MNNFQYNPNIHHRRSIRLKGYDYSKAGLYFITICSQDRICRFGYIENNEMILNNAGKNVNECWLDIPKHFPNIVLHEYIIMPNHIHGIVEIVGANQHSPENTPNQHKCDIGAKNVSPPRSPSKTIGSVVRGFKIVVTKWFHNNTNVENVWQRNYYEHIIRDEQSYRRISDYIINNPKKWNCDKFYLSSN